MSASNENKRPKAEENQGRSYGKLYAALAVVVAMAAVALFVWNSNFFQSRATAVTINGQDYTAADVSYYYANIKQYQAYLASMGASTFDSTVSADAQVYDQATGQTWHDAMLEQAIVDLQREVAMADAAKAEGHTLSADAQATVDSTLKSLESSRIATGYSSTDAYLRAKFGSTMSYDSLVTILNRSMLAQDYAQAKQASFTYTQADLDAYYQENKDILDTYIVSQFLFQATVPTETDAQGNVVVRTQEETAALMDAAKQRAKAVAEEVTARLEAGEDPAKLNEEYADRISYSYISERRLGGALNTAYAEWAFDENRKSTDVSFTEYDGGSDTVYNYCVSIIEDRFLDDSPTSNIRHIFLAAGSDPSEGEYETAKATAESLLSQWQSDGATEEAFAQLATLSSADTSSASNGGLLNVSRYNNYGQSFVDWALDPGRKSGDTGILKNDFSSTKGYHVMYFVDHDLPQWAQESQALLLEQDFSAWSQGIYDGYTAEKGSGLKYVG